MTVKEWKELLEDVPDDYEVEMNTEDDGAWFYIEVDKILQGCKLVQVLIS